MRFEVLGPIQLRTGTTEFTFRAERERIVLGLLLLRANQVVPVGLLVDTVWGDRPPRNARNQLQGCVSRLRRQLAGAGVTRPIIQTEQSGYRVRLDPEELDLTEFRRLREQARAAAAEGSRSEAARCYRAAVGLWRGAPLDGVQGDRLKEAAATLADEWVQVTEERLQVELALGKAGELVSELTELASRYPYREGLHGALMLALYRAGRQAESLGVYRRLRQLLREELGSEPGPELQRLHKSVLAQDQGLQLAPPAPARQSAPAPPTPHQLPSDVPDFTGRGEALAALDKLVPPAANPAPGPVTIVNVTGTAGVGKTAFAIHWAHRAADRFPDGQLYIDLRGHSSGSPLRPAEALTVMLRSLGTPTDQIPTDEAAAAAVYRSALADRAVLLLLDNARSAAQVRPLLPGSPGCLVLVTSREQLTGLVVRDGARLLPLEVLSPEEAVSLLGSALGAERVAAEPAATAAVARACAYLPLALRVAAAHLAQHPARDIAQYAAQLWSGDRLAALVTEGDEESSVPAALDHSYRTLPEETARLARLLGLAPGPEVTVPAAAALAGTDAPQAARELQRLALRHLLDEPAPGRYTLHDLLRLYLRRLAESNEPESERGAARGRLLTHYLAQARDAARLLYGELLRLPADPEPGDTGASFHTPAEALTWLEAERANLVAAVTDAAAHGYERAAYELADCLRGYFWHSRRAVDWSTMVAAAAGAAERAGDPQAQAAIALSRGDLHLCTDRCQEAIAHYTAAAAHADRAHWAPGAAAALGNLGIAHRVMGQLPEAAASYRRSLSLNERAGRPQVQASMSANLGTIYLVMGRLREAAESYRQALTQYRAVGSASGEATALRNLGAAYHQLGELDGAQEALARAQSLSREVGNRSGEADALAALAALSRDADRLGLAQEQAQASLDIAAEIADRRCEAVALTALGTVALRRGDRGSAAGQLQRALQLARETGDRYYEAETLRSLAATFRQGGDLAAAAAYAHRALGLTEGIGYQVSTAFCLAELAEIALAAQQLTEAGATADRALRLHREAGHRLGEAQARELRERARTPRA